MNTKPIYKKIYSGEENLKSYYFEDGNTLGSTSAIIGAKDMLPCSSRRMYLSLSMPNINEGVKIKKATLKLFQEESDVQSAEPVKFGLYEILGEINEGIGAPPECDEKLIDYAVMKSYAENSDEIVSYKLDITRPFKKALGNAISNLKLELRSFYTAGEEEQNRNITLYGSNANEGLKPTLLIEYETNYEVNGTENLHTHSLGRFAEAAIDVERLNLMFEAEDFSFGGSRMPVTIKHLYSSALSEQQYTANSDIKLKAADFSQMKIGKGYKLNLMQSMVAASEEIDGVVYDGYVYTDENGVETYFKFSTDKETGEPNGNYEDIDTGEMVFNPDTKILTQSEQQYLFDESGRLIKITDEHQNSMQMVYENGKLIKVIDGAGREFIFEYSAENLLTALSAPDGTRITYEYEGEYLSKVAYPDGAKAKLSYTGSKPNSVTLCDKNGNAVYMVDYDFNGERLTLVNEYVFADSEKVKTIETFYTAFPEENRTTVDTFRYHVMPEEVTPIVDCGHGEYVFDSEGNLSSGHFNLGNMKCALATLPQNGINPFENSDMSHLGSVENLILNHNFAARNPMEFWAETSSQNQTYTLSVATDEAAKYGSRCILIKNLSTDYGDRGIYQAMGSLKSGSYTFSAYLKPLQTISGAENCGVYLRAEKSNGELTAESERLFAANGEYTRLVLPFELKESEAVNLQVLVNGIGEVYLNAPQLERGEYANEYSILENSGPEDSLDFWKTTDGVEYSSDNNFGNEGSIYIEGDLNKVRSAHQTFNLRCRHRERENFKLSGFASANGLSRLEREGLEDPVFRLRAEIKYKDIEEIESHIADFLCETNGWQKAELEFAKERFAEVETVTVYAEYGYNTGAAYFEDIQLVRTYKETGLTEEDFKTSEDEAETQDPAETEEAAEPEFTELLDAFGNTLTETTFENGEFGTIYRSFGYNESGNDLVKETDARGNVTEYTVDEATSKNKEVTDRLGNKTKYEYDDEGRTKKVTSQSADGKTESEVEYSYDAFSNLTEITRGDGMKYLLKYNPHHDLESIGVEGKEDGDLVNYTYKYYGGRLKEIAYANGDKMAVTYNGLGQLVAEKWSNKEGALIDHYKYAYDNDGNIVRSIDILGLKEYNYVYEEGKIVRETQSDITLNDDEFVVSKTLNLTTNYFYNSEDSLSKKVTTFADGSEQVTLFEQAENGSEISKTTVGGKTVTSTSKTDNFGRKLFDELQLGTGFVSRQFSYHAGEVTDQHIDNEMLKSSPTTQLVSGITLSDGRTILYEYDAEERITKVIDSEDGVTEYTYDSLGQLLTETVNGEVVNSMVYDNYGNIIRKNGSYYIYDDNWADKLCYYKNSPVVSDEQGNIKSYAGHTLSWQKGRQLWSFDNIGFEYNPSGIRTAKFVGTVRHDYYLDGAKILRETWDDKTLDVLYDNEESVCGIVYRGESYFFLKNLQGDIISITNVEGETVANYRYDAWGKCEIVAGSNPIADVNPFRYRGYYYDKETGLYYLQSRYYDPEMGRFLCGDENFFSGILGTNIYGYCHNNIINGIDSDGERTYFINGINNSSSSGVPQYATDFKKKLMNLGVKDVRTIGIYKCKRKSYIVNTLNGVGKVFLEMLNINVYTNMIVELIKSDLKRTGIPRGSQLNLIGYSGGGQVALNVMAKMKNMFNNVVLIGTPVMKLWKSKTKVSMLYSGKDLLSWNIGWGYKSYFAGWIGHTEYFNTKNIKNTAKIVDSIIN